MFPTTPTTPPPPPIEARFAAPSGTPPEPPRLRDQLTLARLLIVQPYRLAIVADAPAAEDLQCIFCANAAAADGVLCLDCRRKP